MVDRRQIQHTMAAIEARRAILGDAVTNTTLEALQELLQRPVRRSSEVTSQRDAQRKQATVLFAKVTGFAGTDNTGEETTVLNIITALWQRLDGAITHQGGVIDKHIGDADRKSVV